MFFNIVSMYLICLFIDKNYITLHNLLKNKIIIKLLLHIHWRKKLATSNLEIFTKIQSDVSLRK